MKMMKNADRDVTYIFTHNTLLHKPVLWGIQLHWYWQNAETVFCLKLLYAKNWLHFACALKYGL